MIWLFAFFPGLVFLFTLFNLLSWKRGEASERVESPPLSILIPARNEERSIAQVLDSLLRAETKEGQIQEIVVCDDGSTDRTAALVQEVSKRDPRVRLISGKPLPPGWVGKPHACQVLFENAQAERLLFVDADVELLPGAFERLGSLMQSSPNIRVLTAVPRQEMKTWVERLVVPLLVLTYTSFLPLKLVSIGRNPSTVAANGQILLISRADLKSLGGFESVRAEIVDDVAFCRHAKVSGYPVLFADGFELAECRMYRSGQEVVEGFSKNIYEGVGGKPVGLLGVLSLYFFSFVLPYFLIPFAVYQDGFESALSNSLLGVALLSVSLNLAIRVLLALRFKQPWSGVILHPVAVLFLMGIAVNSFLWSVRGKLSWAGRSYPARAQRVSEGAS